MKKFVVWGVILLGLAFAGCSRAPKVKSSTDAGLIYRHHFVGTAKVDAGTNATKLKEILALEATKAVGTQIVAKLARVPGELWPKQVEGNSGDLLRPLLEDLTKHESYVEVSGPLANAEWVFAVALPDDRNKLWDKNLRALAERAKLGAPAAKTWEKFNGWEAKPSDSSFVIQSVRAGDWTLVGVSRGEASLLPALVKQAVRSGRPVPELKADALLEFEADTPRLATVLPVLAPLGLPPIQLSVWGRGENLRTEGKLRPGQKFAWKFEPWKIPTNHIPDSIAAFTVAQGVAPLLKNVKPIAELGLKSYPNQFCIWGLDTLQVQTYVTVPVKNATNTIQEIAPNVPKVALKYLDAQRGKFLWISNQAEVHWREVPFVVPSLRPMQDNGQDYVFFSMFPIGRVTNNPPAELFAQLGNRKDLAYYDWEMTGQRLVHGKQTYQLHNLFARRQVPNEKSAPQQWLVALTPLLGNTITELTVVSDQELNLTRKSHIGLSGMELATLALWFDSPGFPFRVDPQPKAPEPPLRTGTNAPSRTE